MKKIIFKAKKDKQISYKFYLIIMEILQINNMEKKDIDLSSFLFTFGHQHKTYEGHLQHDCLEFCIVLLDDINKELNEIEKKPKYSEINYSNKVSKILCENEIHNFFEKYEKSSS